MISPTSKRVITFNLYLNGSAYKVMLFVVPAFVGFAGKAFQKAKNFVALAARRALKLKNLN